MTKKKLVYVIVLNFNNYDDSIKIIRDLQNQQNVNLKILVVDNCSTDDSFSKLKKDLSDSMVSIIQSEKNGGYAYGNNFGLKYIQKEDPKYVAILNPDIRINNKKLFEELISEYSILKDPGFIAPASLDELGEINSYCAKKNPLFVHEILTSFMFLSNYLGRINSYKNKIAGSNWEVEILSGSFLFTSYNFFKKISFFDEGTFLFCEERIIYEKLKKFDKKNYLITKLNINHCASSTISTEYTGIEQIKIFHNSLLYYVSNYHNYGNLKAIILRPFLKFKELQFSIFLSFKAFLKL